MYCVRGWIRVYCGRVLYYEYRVPPTEKQLDWKTLDINKLKVKDLKKILADWGEDCKGCTEKTEFVKRVQELKPKFVKDEL